jgi:hypothetical protein
VASLFRGCAARIVFKKRLGFWLLVDDHVPLRSPNHALEFSRLMARKKREAIILLSNFLILGNCHLDSFCTAKVATFAFAALAEKLEAERFPLRVNRLIDLFDPLVHFADECFVTRLPLETGIHEGEFYPSCAQRTRASAIRSHDRRRLRSSARAVAAQAVSWDPPSMLPCGSQDGVGTLLRRKWQESESSCGCR